MIALGLPSGIDIMRYYASARPIPPAQAFAATPEMWAAVRRHAGPADRVGNNPLFLESMTPWPVNISWALLVEPPVLLRRLRPRAAVHPAAAGRLREIDAQFQRVFSGDGWPDDLRELATKYRCQVVVVTALDGAWTRDPFATSEHWRLVGIERARLAHLCRRRGGDGVALTRPRTMAASNSRSLGFARPAEKR